MWARDGRIDLLMGAEVKDCSVANRSDFGLTGRFPGVCVCVTVCVDQGLPSKALVLRKG